MSTLIKVRVRGKSQLYIHNDLSNAAFYFWKRINQRFDDGDHEGIALEVTACLTMIAFAAEARVNFLGYRLIDPWRERDPAWVKLETISKHLGIDPDKTTRPFLTLDRLKSFRDAIAHGKPKEIPVDTELVTTQEELEKKNLLETEWDTFITREFMNEAYEDAEGLWRDMLKASGLNIMDTLTQGERQFSIIANVGDLVE
ncbi:hypothetical protein G6L46_10940 [Agrobacterium rhizogenes]|uniref:hypothetical protein n=1 Tax=Rhizobium rhizogenes TaxID=359 RepID=UPI0015745646|nr:hypothetical protein [Rhizobium rhizogenes]NTF87640.1 hypothetical protein [Rhizobium rhizogenes]